MKYPAPALPLVNTRGGVGRGKLPSTFMSLLSISIEYNGFKCLLTSALKAGKALLAAGLFKCALYICGSLSALANRSLRYSKFRSYGQGLRKKLCICRLFWHMLCISKKAMLYCTAEPVTVRFSHCVLKMYSPGESQHIFLSALSSHSLKAIKDLPVPVGWITAALPVSVSFRAAEMYAVSLCSKSLIPLLSAI